MADVKSVDRKRFASADRQAVKENEAILARPNGVVLKRLHSSRIESSVCAKSTPTFAHPPASTLPSLLPAPPSIAHYPPTPQPPMPPPGRATIQIKKKKKKRGAGGGGGGRGNKHERRKISCRWTCIMWAISMEILLRK